MTRVLVAALLVAACAGTATAEPLRVRARAFDGVTFHDVLEVVADQGRIVSVDEPGGGPALEIPGAVLTPGFLDLDARHGLSGGDAEMPEAFSPDLLLADAFAPGDAGAESLRRSGVTAAWLLGGAENVVSGVAAVVQPAVPGERPAVLLRSWGLSASLHSAARMPERAPTSLPDQARELERLLGDGAVGGPARIRFDDGAALREAASIGIPVGLPPRAEDLVELDAAPGLVASADWTLVDPATLARLAEWMKRGRLALGSGDSDRGAAAVRLAAARLVEEGVAEERVLRALTSDAARLAGRDDLGRLRPGARADLVLWSGSPASLASRPLRVWIAGREILHAP